MTDPVAPAPPSPRRDHQPLSGRTLILVAAILAVAAGLAMPLRAWLNQRSALQVLSVEIEQARATVDALTQQRDLWHQPAYVERQARLRLNLVRPGEAGLIALDHDQIANTERAVTPPATWSQRLWHSTRTVAGDVQEPNRDDAG